MTVFVEFIVANAAYIYGLCAVLALFLLRSALRTRRERRSAIFPLEKEVALGRIYRLLGQAVLLALVMAGIWALGRYVLPTLGQLQPETVTKTSVLILIDTPSPTPPPPTATPTATATPRPQPTRRPTPNLAAATATPIYPLPVCANPAAAITSPGAGQIASSLLPVTGTANTPGFQFYKLEWRWEGNPEVWHWFGGSETPAIATTLAAFNPTGLPAGAYDLRLVVVDNTGNYPEPCTVRVIVP